MKRRCTLALLLLLLPTLASAERRRAVRPPSAVFSEYQIPGIFGVRHLDDNIAVGTDGTVWFTAHEEIPPPPRYFVGYLAENKTPVVIPVDRKTYSVTVAAGVAWFGSDDGLLQVDTSGAVDFFAVRKNAFVRSVTTDSEQNVWFTENGRIGRIDSNTHTLTEYDLPYRWGAPARIAVGGDDSVWFVSGREVGHLSRDGKLTDYQGDALFENTFWEQFLNFTSLAAARDGSIWVVATGFAWTTSYPSRTFLARISPSGEFKRMGLTRYTTAFGIAVSDHYVWITDCKCARYSLDSSELVAFTFDGSTAREFPVPRRGQYPEKVITQFALAPDGSFWVTYSDFQIVARVVLLNSGL